MPPKVKITNDDIIKAAVEIVRKKGEAQLNARTVAKELNCSTQPIFSNFGSMEQLKLAVINFAEALSESYIKQETQSGKYPPYKASGMAYIRFAKEEKELFRLLYMRDRTSEVIPEETDLGNRMEDIVHNNIGLDATNAKLFHLEMWVYVHGIAAMFATGYLDIEWELVSKMLTDVYEGMKKRYETE